MKKFLTHLMLVIVAVALSTGIAFALAPLQSDPVIADVASDGTVSSIDLDGGAETFIEFGDPDDGITGNRGLLGESCTGAGSSGLGTDGPTALSTDVDLLWQLYGLYLQFQFIFP